MRTNKILTITSIFIILILITGCAMQPTGKVTQDNEVIKIGVINGMTGKVATYGQKVFVGLTIAEEEINQNNLAGNKKIKLIYEDTRGNAQNAINAFNKLKNIDKVSAIIGPLVSENVLTVGPLAEKEKTLLFVTVSGADDIKDLGDYVFRNRASALGLSSYFADYLYNNENVKEIAILYMNSGNGITYKEGFTQEFENIGGKIITTETYERGEKEFKTTILKLKNNNVKHVFIAGYAEEIAAIYKQSAELGFEPHFYSNVGVESDDFVKLTGELSDGTLFCTESVDLKNANNKTKNFVEKYKSRTGKEPDFFALNSYDALMLIVEAGNKYGFTSDGIKKGLYEIKDYEGVSGKMSFDENGEVIKDFAVKQIRDGKFVAVT